MTMYVRKRLLSLFYCLRPAFPFLFSACLLPPLLPSAAVMFTVGVEPYVNPNNDSAMAIRDKIEQLTAIPIRNVPALTPYGSPSSYSNAFHLGSFAAISLAPWVDLNAGASPPIWARKRGASHLVSSSSSDVPLSLVMVEQQVPLA